MSCRLPLDDSFRALTEDPQVLDEVAEALCRTRPWDLSHDQAVGRVRQYRNGQRPVPADALFWATKYSGRDDAIVELRRALVPESEEDRLRRQVAELEARLAASQRTPRTVRPREQDEESKTG